MTLTLCYYKTEKKKKNNLPADFLTGASILCFETSLSLVLPLNNI